MDNAVIHRSKQIREVIERTNNDLLYSVPYHPETNAIEEFFSQLKHYIKIVKPILFEDINFYIISRLSSAATATGYSKIHAKEQEQIITAAFTK